MLTDYEVYLQGEHWQKFRAEILASRPRCERCNLRQAWSVYFYSVGLNIHHLSYENLGHEGESEVLVLCIACHALEHGKPVPELFSQPKTPWRSFVDRFIFPGVMTARAIRARREELRKQSESFK